MHALEAIGMKAGAVLFFPDDLLGDLQARPRNGRRSAKLRSEPKTQIEPVGLRGGARQRQPASTRRSQASEVSP